MTTDLRNGRQMESIDGAWRNLDLQLLLRFHLRQHFAKLLPQVCRLPARNLRLGFRIPERGVSGVARRVAGGAVLMLGFVVPFRLLTAYLTDLRLGVGHITFLNGQFG